MKTLAQLKKEIREMNPDLEDGETFEDFWKVYCDALREDDQIVKIGKRLYVKEG